MSKFKEIPLDFIKESYFLDEGKAILKKKSNGKPVGSIKKLKGGYNQAVVTINGDSYIAARVFWSIYNNTPCPTDKLVDHIDRNPLNQSRDNLRLASRLVNARNRSLQSGSKSGVNGVNFCNTSKIWKVKIGRKVLGVRASFFEAVCLRKSAELSTLHYTTSYIR